jgi:hypothetical protein
MIKEIFQSPERADLMRLQTLASEVREKFVMALKRLNHAPAPSAPQSYGQVSSFSKVHRREGQLASAQMELVIFALFFCFSAEWPSPATAASRRRRKWSGHRPGCHDQERVNMLITGRRRRRPRRGILLLQQRRVAAGSGLSTGLGTTVWLFWNPMANPLPGEEHSTSSLLWL